MRQSRRAPLPLLRTSAVAKDDRQAVQAAVAAAPAITVAGIANSM